MQYQESNSFEWIKRAMCQQEAVPCLMPPHSANVFRSGTVSILYVAAVK